MKKVALIFFGLSYYKYFNHWTCGNYIVDFRNSYENYQKFIYSYFHKLGYEIDVYFCTNILEEEHLIELLNMYKPKKYTMIKNYNNKFESRNTKLSSAVKCCLDSGVKYDVCLITRFDLLFQKEFETCNINFETINIVSILEKPNLICDNFYLLPYRLLEEFYKLIENNIYTRFHDIRKPLSKISEINYIYSEHVVVSKLSFYKIIRTQINLEDLIDFKKKERNNNFFILFLIILLILIIMYFINTHNRVYSINLV